MQLLRSDREVHTVFDLLGDKENDMTFSLGWVLVSSQEFLGALLKDITGKSWTNTDKALVRLQTGRVGQGITDLEIELGVDLALIVEAKRGAQVPSIEQLGRYAKALVPSNASHKALLSLTNATAHYASVALPSEIEGIPLLHRSWRQLKGLAEEVANTETNVAKRWLRHFTTYLEGLLKMETRYLNWTYVVSLAGGNPEGWSISWVDIVEKSRRYFYGIGMSGWPDPPPNYNAFRYSGRLQSICHVQSYEVFTNPHDIFPEAPNASWDPSYCLRLGPPIRPQREVPTGPRINHAARVWCMIDTLLTAKTISDALTESQRRDRTP